MQIGKSNAKGSFVQSKKLPEIKIELKEEYREYKIMVISSSDEELSNSLAKRFPNCELISFSDLEAKEYHFDKEKLKEVNAIVYHGGNAYVNSVN